MFPMIGGHPRFRLRPFPHLCSGTLALLSFPDSCLLSNPQDLATPEAFAYNPSRVWEFYHYRREMMQSAKPNPGHLAIAECEARLQKQDRRVTVITQNIDELHRKAGTKNLLEIHGEHPKPDMGRGPRL